MPPPLLPQPLRHEKILLSASRRYIVRDLGSLLALPPLRLKSFDRINRARAIECQTNPSTLDKSFTGRCMMKGDGRGTGTVEEARMPLSRHERILVFEA